MSNKDIEIHIKTTGDPSGAEQVQKSIFGIEDAAKQAERELDVLNAKARKAAGGNAGGLLGVDVTGVADRAVTGAAGALGYGGELEILKNATRNAGGAIAADAAILGGAFVAIGASAIKSYQVMSEAVTGYKKLMEEAKAQGQDLGPELAAQVAILESTLSPLSGVLEGITEKASGFWNALTNPVDTFTGLGPLREALNQQQEAAKKLAEIRSKIASENQAGLGKIYGDELTALREQESTMQRIARLRSQMTGLEMTGAQQEVQSAKLRGGDVALAEANALAVQIRAGTEKLSEELRGTKANAEIAEREYNAAFGSYQQGIRDKVNELDPDKFSALAKSVDDKKAALDAANGAVNDQAGIFQEARNNLLRGAENQLATLENEYADKASPAAKKAFDSIYQSFQTAVSQGPQQVIDSIKVDVEAVTSAANVKAAEVNSGIAKAAQHVDTVIGHLSTNVDRLIGIGSGIEARLASQDQAITRLEQVVSQMNRQ